MSHDWGVLALSPDRLRWHWRTEHYIFEAVARTHPVVWAEPALEWRKLLQIDHRPVDGNMAAPSGVTLYRPPRWLPQLYKPARLARALAQARLEQARRKLVKLGCERVLLSIWRPQLADALDWDGYDLSAYHITDEYSFSEVEQPVSELEAATIRRSDLVFCSSPALLAKQGRLNPKTSYLPNGVDFESYATPQPMPAELESIPRPIVGYTGIIKRQLDLDLLAALATRRPQWSFVFVGPIGFIGDKQAALERLERQPNVHLLGARPANRLAAYAQHFDVATLCYAVNDYTRYISPMKLNEYLAAGVPAVGSPIRSLEEYGFLIRLASGVEEWERALEAALDPVERCPEKVAARQSAALELDWGRLADAFIERVDERLRSKSGTGITEPPTAVLEVQR